jgi:3-oxoadipate enol-lactonase
MREITANDHTFSYRDLGDGPAALFVHGFPLDSTMWIEQLEALSDARRCIAPDLRGFGRSTPTTRDMLSMEEHADDLIAILDALDIDRVDLVGFSMGGYVALDVAGRYPDRLRSLALVDTKSTADSEEAKVGRDDAAIGVAMHGRSQLADTMIGALLDESASIWIRARIRTMVESMPSESIVAALRGMKRRPDRTAVLSGLSIPVAVVVGEHDVVTPLQEADHMASAAGAEMVVVADAGHMTPIEDPAAVAAALRALWSLDASGD